MRVGSRMEWGAKDVSRSQGGWPDQSGVGGWPGSMHGVLLQGKKKKALVGSRRQWLVVEPQAQPQPIHFTRPLSRCHAFWSRAYTDAILPTAIRRMECTRRLTHTAQRLRTRGTLAPVIDGYNKKVLTGGGSQPCRSTYISTVAVHPHA